VSTSSSKASNQRLSVRDIAAHKGGTPVVCITAYTTPMAQFMDAAVDVLLVGDSLGMVLYGFDTTLPVTLDMMVQHGAAVVRGSKRACVVVDMPFGMYQSSPVDAFKNCSRVMAETGCTAVKLEGGVAMAETIAFLVARGIPVMGHVGLTPQSVHQMGGYRTQGKSTAEADAILADARAIAEAGAFSIVVEGVTEPLARTITESVACPTIGIGASAACDGQVLVAEDMLGLFSTFTPKFVKRYADLGSQVTAAVEDYAAEVRARAFPGPAHVVGAKKT
jgi:3-methyl-2-oxobutanoate hydroxymethyltransferase